MAAITWTYEDTFDHPICSSCPADAEFVVAIQTGPTAPNVQIPMCVDCVNPIREMGQNERSLVCAYDSLAHDARMADWSQAWRSVLHYGHHCHEDAFTTYPWDREPDEDGMVHMTGAEHRQMINRWLKMAGQEPATVEITLDTGRKVEAISAAQFFPNVALDGPYFYPSVRVATEAKTADYHRIPNAGWCMVLDSARSEYAEPVNDPHVAAQMDSAYEKLI